MYIDKLILSNFKIYYGRNELELNKTNGQTITIVSGNNGYGKTTLLTSLLWCLYGKLIIDVDDKYKKEIYDAGGYKKYAISNLNRLAKREGVEEYTVEILFSDIFIPSIPCNHLILKRTFNTKLKEDKLDIIIDGSPSELTKEVGPEIFINDFILPKEIAKFFFFDAEKIVSLAEINTIDDKKMLSKAYSEVLGIKKYEDLKNNLNELRIRLRRNNILDNDKKKLDNLYNEINKINEHIKFIEVQISNLQEEREQKRKYSDFYQEKLIREGNSITKNELLDLRKKKKDIEQLLELHKNSLKGLLELAPFAIASEQLVAIKNQINVELEKKISQPEIRKLLRFLELSKQEIRVILKSQNISKNKANHLTKEIVNAIKEKVKKITSSKEPEYKTLHDFSEVERNEFLAIYDNLKNSFSILFNHISKELKSNKSIYYSIQKKLIDSESKEEDLLIKEIRNQKDATERQIEEIENNLFRLNQELGKHSSELTTKNKIFSEIRKRVEVEERDKAKDIVAKRLSDKLVKYLHNLRIEKKRSLEKRIFKELNLLMHKNEFIKRVEVDVSESLIDINLYDSHNEIIIKDNLSKGEQQLYATALLKALVDESNIKFPVFIDSPLQKFDKEHSKNIICEFYPSLSDQVVIFPLLYKELSEYEYEILRSNIQNCYIIKNINQDSSKFVRINPDELFTEKDLALNVYKY